MKILQINTVPNKDTHSPVRTYGLGDDNEMYLWEPVEFTEVDFAESLVHGIRPWPIKWAWVRINKQQDNDTTQ